MTNMDGLVLVDALASIMGHEEKELCKPGHLAMVLVLDTATNIMGSRERACRLKAGGYMLCLSQPSLVNISYLFFQE